MKRLLYSIIIILPLQGFCQKDTLSVENYSIRDTLPDNYIDYSSTEITTKKKDTLYNFTPKAIIIPATFVTTGAFLRSFKGGRDLNRNIRHWVIHRFDKKRKIDDYAQYLPITGVFALSNMGVKPQHNVKERLLIGATAYIIMATTINVAKYTIRDLRPDNSSFNSFPSGHTATVFTGTEILWQEYKNENIWIGIIGYSIATTTGLLRIYNNRHWLTDVVAGAGIGILSAKIAYWLFPTTSNLVFGKEKHNDNQNMALLIYPVYSSNMKGIGATFTF